MTKRVDENWKLLQQTTFMKYINTSLRRDQKTSTREVTDLQTDLQDGLILIQLLESIASPKRLGVYNKRPFIKAQKLENLGACFRFFEREKIKLVNIGTFSEMESEYTRGSVRNRFDLEGTVLIFCVPRFFLLIIDFVLNF